MNKTELKMYSKAIFTNISQKIAIILLGVCAFQSGYGQEKRNSFYITNQQPLIVQPYTALPLGAIKPKGMLLEMLHRQRDGLTGQLDSIYSLVCGPLNGWLGGAGDGWERGPYWLDGLAPLAFILDDQRLKDKAQVWIEWCIQNQEANGYFGPKPLPKGYSIIEGVQQDNREDWWPKMVMLKVLQQYYSATNDKRVINMMSKYFRYMLAKLPQQPLGHWTYWGAQRGGDNLAIVYWLYNITHEKFLLELGELVHKQTTNWTQIFTDNSLRKLNPFPDLHCVNVAQGLKEPLIYYQQSKSPQFNHAVREGLSALRDVHGFVNGMYGGDEHLHGNNPTQGSELCSAVELMYSFESVLPVTGDVFYADYLEKIAYNVLPTQITDDYMRKQYFQEPNQVLITNESRNFFDDNNGHLLYGTSNGYPCCLTNMHQGWPKFIQNLWYATNDNGAAALVYGESEVSIKVGGGQPVKIIEETGYPFSEQIKFTFQPDKEIQFPFHLRIPAWCKSPVVQLNGKDLTVKSSNGIVVLNRKWSPNDVVVLTLPMSLVTSVWYNSSAGIERGPLVYALKVEEDWKEVHGFKSFHPLTETGSQHNASTRDFEDTYWEVRPKSAWNYSLTHDDLSKMNFTVQLRDSAATYPWNLENAPIVIRARGFKVPGWTIVNGAAGMLPSASSTLSPAIKTAPMEEIELIPYGCTTLRISQFPVLK